MTARAAPARLAVTPQRLSPGRLVPPPLGDVHLWLAAVRSRPSWMRILDPAERGRARDRPAGRVRDTFVTSRAVQRLIGARYLGGEPSEVSICRHCAHCDADHGRPRFPEAGIDYSVSHARDWLLVAVASHGLVGVDVEWLDPARDTDSLATAALTAAECERYRTLPPAQRRVDFVSAWTRKEAAMKLTGLGLAAWPDRLDVSGPLVSVELVPRWPAAPVHLYGLPAPVGYVAALASTVPVEVARSILLR